MDIKEALAQLDSMEDSHWTADGAPATQAVSDLIGQKVTRAQITDAAPKFSRENMDLTEIEEETTDAEEGLREGQEEVTDEPVDASILAEFAEMEPMLPNEFADKVLQKADPRLLPQIETMLTEQLQAIEAKEKEVEEMKRKVKLSKALTVTWIKQLVPDMSNQEAIQAYIRSSQENRAAKAAEIQKVLGGLKPADIAKLDPRAAIDKAFARKTARGGQRPVR
jgi:hypothetical protein